ncbi:MAG: hypothetical protein K2M12_06070, partial [Muribaculaceae bacterium]|nr:hypothetical protein [Muribaculaceae bacterium]
MAKKRTLHISVLGSRITSVVSVTLVLILLGLTALMACATHRATDSIRRNMGFTVKMQQNATSTDINNIKKVLTSARYVESFVFAGEDEILAQDTEI